MMESVWVISQHERGPLLNGMEIIKLGAGLSSCSMERERL